MVFKLLKCKINYILLSIFFFISSFSFSQNIISGVVVNNNNETLSYANVTAYNENETKLIAYAISDESGKYNLELENNLYLFKVSYLGYKSFSVKKNITEDNIINFKLTEDATSLDEIIIKSKSLDASIRNDTIKYNLKRLTNGNEVNLKDVLNKLPGVEIDENGKIKANGKKIDKLLIDGKEFFGDQHQFATENISSEMIKGVSLLENFSDFSDLENQTKSGKTAMNIEIDADYKGKIKGNISTAGGYKNKYELNTNLFTFKKKTNLFFIGSLNNIGNQTFSFEDYISFQGGIQKLLSNNSNSSTISGKDLPSYLLSNNNVKSKYEQFSALNFSYNPSNKFKLNSYLIFDKTNITEEQLTKQTYFTNNQNIHLNLDNSRDNTFLMNNSFVNAIYKPTNRTILEYTLSFSPQKNDLSSKNNFNTEKFVTERNNHNYSLNQTLDYKRKFSKYLLSSTIYHSLRDNTKELNLSSNSEFLGLTFQNSDYSTFQSVESSNYNYGFNTFLSRKINKNTSFKIKYNISKINENFKSDVLNSSLKNNITLDVLENLIGINFYNKEKTFINYEIGANYSLINSNKLENYNFLPFINFKLNFKKTHSLYFSYKRTLKLPQVENIINDSYISNFNTLINNQNIVANTVAKYDNFGVRYFIYDLFSGTLLSFGSDFILGKNVITTNTIDFSDYSVNYHRLGNNDKNINAYLLFDKKFSKIPFKIRLKNTFSLSERNSFINDVSNKFDVNTLSNNFKISSNFRKSLFNFELGYKRKQNIIESMSINLNNKLILNVPYLNLFINYQRFDFTINNSIEFYNSNVLEQEFYRIDPIINYRTKDEKWAFYIKGKDILNMNKNYIIENAIYENYLEEKRVSTLGGFIITGLKYKF